MKQYYNIYYQYSEGGKRVICRQLYGTHPERTKEYKKCKLNLEGGYIYAYGYEVIEGKELHDILVNKYLRANNIQVIEG